MWAARATQDFNLIFLFHQTFLHHKTLSDICLCDLMFRRERETARVQPESDTSTRTEPFINLSATVCMYIFLALAYFYHCNCLGTFLLLFTHFNITLGCIWTYYIVISLFFAYSKISIVSNHGKRPVTWFSATTVVHKSYLLYIQDKTICIQNPFANG